MCLTKGNDSHYPLIRLPMAIRRRPDKIRKYTRMGVHRPCRCKDKIDGHRAICQARTENASDDQADQAHPNRSPATPHRPPLERTQNTPPPSMRPIYQNTRPDQTFMWRTKRMRDTNSRQHATQTRNLTHNIGRHIPCKQSNKTGDH